MTTPEIKDHLTTLLASPGWALFVQHFQQEWGRGGNRYCDLLERSVNKPASTDEEQNAVTKDFQQVVWLRKEMETVMRWPAEMLHATAPQPVEYAQSRRGGL